MKLPAECKAPCDLRRSLENEDQEIYERPTFEECNVEVAVALDQAVQQPLNHEGCMEHLESTC